MLRGRDIQTIAGREKVRDTQIEKDYALTWLLWGVAQNTLLKQALIFKGGTVLKKAYFENYRFSEDLDFTLVADTSDTDLLSAFAAAFAAIEEQSAMTFEASKVEQHQSGSIAFYAHFVGPLGGKMENKSVKIDITRGEKLLFLPVERTIFSTYTDLQDQDFRLLCYPFEEIMVEKLVALMGRTQPRDVYDVWYLLKEEVVELEFLQQEFATKAQHKGHKADDFLATWQRKTKLFERQWNQYLAHQIADLPNFEEVSRALNRYFKIFASK